MGILTREDLRQYKILATFLAAAILILAIFSYYNYDNILLMFGKVRPVSILEKGDGFTLYQNNDGSRTLVDYRI